MNRIELNKKIKDIYQNTLNSNKDKFKSSHLSKLALSVSGVEDRLGVIMDELAPELTADISDDINKLISDLRTRITDSSPSITHSKFHEKCSEMASEYVEAVESFTKSGGTGFYDIGVRFNITYDMDIKKVTDIITEMKKNGDDIVIVDEINKGNAEHSQFKTASTISVMLPSSLYENLSERLNPVMDKMPIINTTESITKQQYFISPRINDINSLTVDEVKDTIKHFRDAGNSWDIESGFASIGYSRFEISEWSRDTVKSKVTDMLLHIELYSRNSNDPINGVMPTPYLYSEKEIKKYGFSGNVTKDAEGNSGKQVNIVDGLTMYNANEEQDLKRKNQETNKKSSPRAT